MELKRGAWLKPGNEITLGVPVILHSLSPDADGSRLTLATTGAIFIRIISRCG